MTPPAPGHPHEQEGRRPEARLLHRSVRLVERALALAGHDGPASPAIGPQGLDHAKVRCEAAMLLRSAAPVAGLDPDLSAGLRTLAGALAEHEPAEVAVGLCLRPGITLDLALVPLHLRAVGLGDARFDPLLADLLGPDRVRGPERPPHRELEQLWLLGLWSGTVDAPAVAHVLARSALAWQVDHLAGTTEDAYAVTHAILYATDHGRRRVPLPRAESAIRADVDALLAVALDAGNLDVAAEVLWAWPMLGLPETPLASEARDHLREIATARGFLPGPGFDHEVHEALPLPEKDPYVLRTSYHTTLVHGLLLAAGLVPAGPLRARSAPTTPPAPERAEVMDALLPAALAAGTPGHAWWSRVSGLPRPRREALAPALVTASLRRAVTIADLGGVQRVLAVVAGAPSLGGPAVDQAGALLRRSLACAAFAGPPQSPTG